MELYAVTAGLALAAALESAFSSQGRGVLFEGADWQLLVAFVVTLVPFYHGAMRHLDDEWVDAAEPAAPWLMLVDFGVLFVQAAVFFVLGRNISDPTDFSAWYAILLGTDVVWATVYLLGRRARRLPQDPTPHKGGMAPEATWALINSGALVVLAALAIAGVADSPVALLLVAVGRTAVDYRVSWSFYFPHAQK